MPLDNYILPRCGSFNSSKHDQNATYGSAMLSVKYQTHVNYMNVSVQDKPTKETAFTKWSTCIDKYPKMAYKVKEICGDYYYEKMSKEETIKKAFLYAKDAYHELKCQKDIDGYVRDNMNTKV